MSVKVKVRNVTPIHAPSLDRILIEVKSFAGKIE